MSSQALDREKRRLCREMLKNSMPRREIAALLHMSSKTISKIANDRQPNARPRGRLSKLTKEQISFIEEQSLCDATITDGEMAKMLQERFGVDVSRVTVLRVRRDLGFQFRPPKVKQDLTDQQKAARVEFCKWVMQRRDTLGPIVFSDESRFAKSPDNRWRRIRRGLIDDSCFVKTGKFTKSVMVWGGICVAYRTDLIRCSHHVDSREYQSIVSNSRMIDVMNDKYGRGKWLFMQDGAPAHNSRDTQEYFVNEKVCLLPGWPPNSPDLNPIEMIWGIMKRKANWVKKTEAEMFDYVTEIWNNLDESIVNRLVGSFFDRCELVLRTGGDSINPFLKGRCRPAGPLPSFADSWTTEQDDQLQELHARFGSRWSQIARELGRDPAAVRHRVSILTQMQRNQHIATYRELPAIGNLLALAEHLCS